MDDTESSRTTPTPSSPVHDLQHISESQAHHAQRLNLTSTPDTQVSGGVSVVEAAAAVTGDGKKKPARKERAPIVRETGRSSLPFSRVQRILKADKELPTVARDATFLISLAAEEFISRMVGACQSGAQKANRTTVYHRDFAALVHRAEEYAFLEDIVPLDVPVPGGKSTMPKKTPPDEDDDKKDDDKKDDDKNTLHHYFLPPRRNDDSGVRGHTAITNEDGTMMSVGPSL